MESIFTISFRSLFLLKKDFSLINQYLRLPQELLHVVLFIQVLTDSKHDITEIKVSSLVKKLCLSVHVSKIAYFWFYFFQKSGTCKRECNTGNYVLQMDFMFMRMVDLLLLLLFFVVVEVEEAGKVRDTV